MRPTCLVHSFSRPKPEESEQETTEKALLILEQIRNIGFVLAPEIIEWDLAPLGFAKSRLEILQRRICFTEIEPSEVAKHCKSFGPLALAFDTSKLRDSGAMPAIYIPQGLTTPLSQLATFCVNGAYHTKKSLEQFQQLKELSDPEVVANKYCSKVLSDYSMTLNNTDQEENVAASYVVPALHVQQLLKHAGFNNIPFDHSIGVLNVFLSMFCPTDNRHKGELLGYYQQREWRLIAGDVNLNGRPIGRELTDSEKNDLTTIDSKFWDRSLIAEGTSRHRKDLALIYKPTEKWNPFDLVESIYAPKSVHARIQRIVGRKIPIHAQP